MSIARPHAKSARSLPFAVGALFAALALSTMVFGGPEGLGANETAQAEGVPFSHADHVHLAWWTDPSGAPECAQDCRGCHDFANDPVAAAAPRSDLCTSCHRGGPRTFVDVGSAIEAEGSGFPHAKHLGMECRACHGPQTLDPAQRGELGAAMPVPVASNLDYCASCHASNESLTFSTGKVESGRPTERTFEPAELRSKLQGLIAGREIAPSQPLVFRHADHLDLPLAALSGPIDDAKCLECHSELGGSGQRNLSAVRVDTAACAKCHTGVEFETRSVPAASHTAATFLHHRHVGASYAGKQLACTTCHEFETAHGASGTFTVSADFRGDAYGKCIECHADRKVEAHGELRQCTSCHAMQEGGLSDYFALRTNRPTFEVERPAPGSYAFGLHAHATFAQGESCKECHRAPPDVRRSDVEGRPFDHRSHLPRALLAALAAGSAERDDVRAACRVCHLAIEESDGPRVFAATAEARGHPLLEVYDATACEDCHRSAVVATRRMVPERALDFSHIGHRDVSMPDGSPIDCLTCHVGDPGSSDPLAFAVRPGAANCKDCHGHGESTPVPLPRNLGTSSVTRCSGCHKPGIPEVGAAVAVERQRLARQIGTFVHGSGANCAECHRRTDGASPSADAARMRESRETAGVLASATIPPGPTGGDPNSPHTVAAAAGRGDPHSHFGNLLPATTPAGRSCLVCHWADTTKQRTYPPEVFKLGRSPEGVRRDWGLPLGEPWQVGLRQSVQK